MRYGKQKELQTWRALSGQIGSKSPATRAASRGSPRSVFTPWEVSETTTANRILIFSVEPFNPGSFLLRHGLVRDSFAIVRPGDRQRAWYNIIQYYTGNPDFSRFKRLPKMGLLLNIGFTAWVYQFRPEIRAELAPPQQQWRQLRQPPPPPPGVSGMKQVGAPSCGRMPQTCRFLPGCFTFFFSSGFGVSTLWYRLGVDPWSKVGAQPPNFLVLYSSFLYSAGIVLYMQIYKVMVWNIFHPIWDDHPVIKKGLTISISI